ncbi:MAG TPA: hypothetical protein VEV84_13085 [Pyrinomonadaceae bacterium]|jgi:hypothetical protein|nr:hypothetical protein [Pyrinomonadaceae bacterium]
MGYIDFIETTFHPAKATYKIKITDEQDRVTEVPIGSLEEFTELVASLGREKVVLNLRDHSIELIPRLVTV